MPPRSATRPIRPSKASISRTKWPLPSPPMAGLHDMAPTVENLCVNSAVRAPMRAAAAAASQPAWPPPITTTSKRACMGASKDGVVAEAGEGVKSTNFENVSRETCRRRGLLDLSTDGTGPDGARALFTNAEIAEDDVKNVL